MTEGGNVIPLVSPSGAPDRALTKSYVSLVGGCGVMGDGQRATPAPDGGATEPVVRDGSPITVHCPECGYLGTHTGICSWSQMRSGRVWTFRAVALDIGLAREAEPDADRKNSEVEGA